MRPTGEDTERQGASGRASEPRLFDFRRPAAFSREDLRALQIVGETFARQLTTLLSTTLRAPSSVTLASVQALTYEEHVLQTPNPSFLAVLSLQPLPGLGLLQLPLPIAVPAIDLLLGGTGTGPTPQRPLTDIESMLLRGLLDRCLQELAYAFESMVALEPKVLRHESNPQFAQAAAATDMVATLAFTMRIAGDSAEATICVPLTSLQPVLESFSLNPRQQGHAEGDAVRAVAARLLHVPVTVRARFNPVTLTSAEIVGLQVGDVLPLRHPVHAPLQLHVEDVPCAPVVAGERGRRLAVVVVGADGQ